MQTISTIESLDGLLDEDEPDLKLGADRLTKYFSLRDGFYTPKYYDLMISKLYS